MILSGFKYFVKLFVGVGLIAGLIGCEDLIELDLKDADPRVVIVGEITNKSTTHFVTIHRTIPVTSGASPTPVSGASVEVVDEDGSVFVFAETEPGVYGSKIFQGVIGMNYKLEAVVDGTVYEAESKMPSIVNVDSLGVSSATIFGRENIYVTLTFKDPPNGANYYRYLTSVNDGPFQFNAIYSDKFNDGLNVSHDLVNFENRLMIGDRIQIKRQYIDEATYLYWRSIASSNPSSAAPANPPSNIGGGALGYFSAYSLNDYELEVPEKSDD